MSREPSAAQAAEIAKYVKMYQNPEYRMGSERLDAIVSSLERCFSTGASLLDVGCGRGEVLDVALEIGYARAWGTETVRELVDARPRVVEAVAWDLPFASASFEVVTCLDVMEHLLPDDAEPTVRELARVSSRRIVLTISNLSSRFRGVGELHVNRRPYGDWDNDLCQWLEGWRLEWRRGEGTRVSQTWEATR